jgi:hypothetical protein
VITAVVTSRAKVRTLKYLTGLEYTLM